MVEKKKVIKKNVKKIDVIEEKSIIYSPVFPEITIVSTQKIDANYIGIKRKLKSIGIDLFSKIKTENVKSNTDFNFKFPIMPINFKILELVWQKYCNWFNNKFNKQE